MNPEDRMALPGFFPPDSPKLDDRVFALPDGTVELVIAENLDLKATLPEYDVYVATEYGRELHLHCTAGNMHVTVKLGPDQRTKSHVLRITPQDIVLQPGTFRLRVVDHVSKQEIYSKSLTVPNHPMNRWARTPLPTPGGTEEQAYQKIG